MVDKCIFKCMNCFKYYIREGDFMGKIIKFEELRKNKSKQKTSEQKEIIMSKKLIQEAEKELLYDDVDIMNKIYLKEM